MADRTDPLLRWAEPGDMTDIARFFAAEIARDASYVSHGEVQTGLSADGVNWSPDLQALMIEDFLDPGPDRQVAVAMGPDGVVGALVALFTTTDRVSYLTIEDLVVAPAVRSDGVGAALVDFAERAARDRDMHWAFLESGLHNEGAHRFFERHGFNAMSKVFSKKL